MNNFNDVNQGQEFAQSNNNQFQLNNNLNIGAGQNFEQFNMMNQ